MGNLGILVEVRSAVDRAEISSIVLLNETLSMLGRVDLLAELQGARLGVRTISLGLEATDEASGLNIVASISHVLDLHVVCDAVRLHLSTRAKLSLVRGEFLGGVLDAADLAVEAGHGEVSALRLLQVGVVALLVGGTEALAVGVSLVDAASPVKAGTLVVKVTLAGDTETGEEVLVVNASLVRDAAKAVTISTLGIASVDLLQVAVELGDDAGSRGTISALSSSVLALDSAQGVLATIGVGASKTAALRNVVLGLSLKSTVHGDVDDLSAVHSRSTMVNNAMAYNVSAAAMVASTAMVAVSAVVVATVVTVVTVVPSVVVSVASEKVAQAAVMAVVAMMMMVVVMVVMTQFRTGFGININLCPNIDFSPCVDKGSNVDSWCISREFTRRLRTESHVNTHEE